MDLPAVGTEHGDNLLLQNKVKLSQVNMATIHSIKIHPAIGTARLGHSSTGFFIGPECPGLHTWPKGGYNIVEEREKLSPLYGFKHLDQLREFVVRERLAKYLEISVDAPERCDLKGGILS